jgi:hypothetical protein
MGIIVLAWNILEHIYWTFSIFCILTSSNMTCKLWTASRSKEMCTRDLMCTESTIGIQRPRKLQQICGRTQEYKVHVIFLTHTYWTHKYFSYNFCTLGCSILLRKRHKAFRIYFLLLPHHPENNYSFSDMTVSQIPLRTTAKYRPLSSD